MSEGFPDRVTQLRARWLADPSSRVFLQLAEEYRHLGRMQEALEVLEGGLREHPGYLSALVAKGRCLLELGEAEAAREVLERVVQQDVTQMVASKLLVRAYLETGDADRAGQRLELYSLLNDGDPEIEELKRRAEAMNPPAPVEDQLPAPPPRAEAADPFAFDPEPGPRGGDVFDLDSSQLVPAAAPPPSPAPAAAPVFAEAVPAPTPQRDEIPHAEIQWARPAPASAAVAASAPVDDDPFPELTLVGRIGSAGKPFEPDVFAFDEPAAPAEPVDVFAFEQPAAPAVPEAEPADVFAFDQPAPPAIPEAEPAFPAAAKEIPEVASPPVGLPPTPDTASPLTVTLGQLYLRQGHAAEAERIFHAVLERDPDNPVARAELATLSRKRQPLTASRLLAGYNAGGGLRAKRIHLLKSYLQLLKRATRTHVS